MIDTLLFHMINAKLLISGQLFAAAEDVLDEEDIQDICGDNSFLGFPKWYKYLDVKAPKVDGQHVCSPGLSSLNDFWLILLAVIEIMLRVGVMVSIAFIIVGAVKFMLSRGNPEKVTTARHAVQDAIIGLVITVVATASVSYIAGRF